MTLQDLFDSLATGELSQHKLGKDGSISLENYPTVINHINKALKKLHTRFQLKTKEVMLQEFAEVNEYVIHSKNSVSTGTAPYQYILDSVEKPFTDDIIKITGVYSGEGNEVILNDRNRNDSWFTPTDTSLQIPVVAPDSLVSIVYQANHAHIDPNTTDASLVLINLPDVLETALTSYIASRCYVSLGNAVSAQLSSFYMAQYNQEIAEIIRLGTLPTEENTSDLKFIAGGWR